MRNVRLLDSEIRMRFWRFASKSQVPGPAIGRKPSEPNWPGPALRKTILPFASASAVLVHHTVRTAATFAHAGSATLWYCCPKKLPKALPDLRGHTTCPSLGKAPTTSGV